MPTITTIDGTQIYYTDATPGTDAVTHVEEGYHYENRL